MTDKQPKREPAHFGFLRIPLPVDEALRAALEVDPKAVKKKLSRRKKRHPPPDTSG